MSSVHHTHDEYLALEAFSNVKHEFLDGRIYAMAENRLERVALATAVGSLLVVQLRSGKCRAYNSSLRVRTPTGLTTYPDVTVICGPPQCDETDALAVTNPMLIVEVLSHSTEEWDQGNKFEYYKSCPSLRQCVFVSHTERSVEVRTRGEEGEWRNTIVREGEIARLCVGLLLDVRELYDAAAE